MAKGKYPNGLGAIMTARKIGPTELGRIVGESKQQVDRWRKGERELTAATAQKLAPHLGVTAAELLGVDGPKPRKERIPQFRSVPLVSWVSAGKMAGGEIPPNVRAIRRIPAAELGRGEWIALQVQGDSMNLIAPDNSIIFVDIADKRLMEDRFYVFAQENGDSTFKRYRGGRSARLQPYSTNPDHETIPATDEIFVIGRVKRTMLDL